MKNHFDIKLHQALGLLYYVPDVQWCHTTACRSKSWTAKVLLQLILPAAIFYLQLLTLLKIQSSLCRFGVDREAPWVSVLYWMFLSHFNKVKEAEYWPCYIETPQQGVISHHLFATCNTQLHMPALPQINSNNAYQFYRYIRCPSI